MKTFIATICAFLIVFYSQGQDCNCVATATDLTVTNGQTVVVNAYYPGSADALAGSTSITIGTKRTIPGAFTDLGGTVASGDLLMIIQMQGAEIDPTIPDITITINPGVADTYETSDYGDGPGGLDHAGFLDNGSFIAGQYEFIVATNSIGAGGGTLTIQDGLSMSYIANTTPTGNSGKRTFQVIKVGNYNDLTVDAGGEITTVPWNGTTGGVISIDVLGTLDLNGTVDADFAGFRGGHLDLSGGQNGDEDNGIRGEGISGTPIQVFGYNDDFSSITGTTGLATGYPGGSQTIEIDVDLDGNLFFNRDHTWDADRGQGGAGNAGGGGLWNGGGAGGGNGSTGGGGANENAQESAGGAEIGVENGSRLAMGGGGGSGGQTDLVNDGFPEDVNSGRPGGGAILIRADVFQSTGSTGVINANGDDGNTFNATANPSAPDEDGSGGGGGAGGTVIVVTSSEDLSDLTINTPGGDGAGLTGIQQYLSPDGGGGGGAGGSVMLVRRGGDFSATPTIDVTGGAAGATQGTPSENSTGGTGAVTLLTTPPAANLDCPLITLAAPAPGGVSGSIIWFAPDQNVTFNGSNQVTAWNDFSSSNFTLTNTAVTGITGTTPDYIAGSFTDAVGSSNPNFNFNSSISFNEGADQSDYLAFANFSNISTAAITTFAVVHIPASTPNDQTIYSYLPNDVQDDELDLGISNDIGSDGIRKQTLDDPADRAGDLRDATTRIVATDYNNIDVNIYLNNGSATNVVQSAGTFDVSGTFILGQDLDDFATPAFDGNRELQGQLGDVMYFSRVITDTERQQVSSLLAIKYGITLDQTTDQDYLNSIGEAIYPVVTETASYAAYDNDIAGIGRDDGSRLSQLRSRSINSGAIIAGSHTEGFAVDRQFVIWGNDNAALAFDANEISTGITTKLPREWRVAVSNSPDPIDLSFDLSGTTSTPVISANLALVIDDDGDFSNGFLRTVSANSWDGSTATFDNVTLNDDEVITVASVPDAPGGISNLSLWLKVDAGISETGGSVSAWADQSGNGNDATSGNNPTLISNAINSYDVVDFDGANDNMDGAAGFYTQSYFIVAQPDVAVDGTANGFVIGFEDGASTFSGFLLGTNTDGYVPTDRIVHVVGANGEGDEYRSGRPDGTFTTLDEPVIYSSSNNTGATEQDLFSNGTDINPVQYANGLKNLSNEQYRLGNNYVNNNYYNGGIAEILSYSTALTATEREKIQSYLAIKYGVTLDGDETNYIASDGDFIYETVIAPADYNNDIAGIGRDDISILDQRKSLGINVDAIVTIAATDNAGTFASPNTLTANLSFLAWGNDNDDNGAIEDVTTEIPSSTLTRLDREWRVQEKGTVGNVTMEIDISAVDPNGVETDFTGRTASSFKLLIDDGGDFSNGITRSVDATSFDSGTEIITFDVDFIDGDIFTVSTSAPPTGPGGVISNIRPWLQSGVGVTTTGANVTGWTDQSGNGFDGAAGVGNVTVSPGAFNGNDAFVFDGSGYLDITAMTDDPSTADLTLFVVAQSNGTGGELISQSGSTASGLMGMNASENGTSDMGSASSTTSGSLTTTAPSVLDYTYSDPNMQWYLDGTTDDLDNAGSATSSAGAWRIGASSDATGNFDGSIAEFIAYREVLSDTERIRVESYLAVKYGITLNGGDYDYESSDGTVFFAGNSDTDFASHRADVAGIGRDDNSSFEQLTSKSVNSTSSLTVTKNAVFGGDNQYVAWAHDGTAMSAATATDFPSGTESRIDRLWKIKLTNSPSGTVDLTFDLSSVNVDQASDLRILVDGDGDFSDATILNPTVSQNGNNYTFTAVDLSIFTDEDFFTISSIDNADSPLPLDWLGFDVTARETNVGLTWKTTNELNVSHFEVERSFNGENFQVIGRVSAENASGIHTYNFDDYKPFKEISYYRIKQVDFDGNFDRTEVKFAIISEGEWIVNIYPNPVQNELTIGSSLRTTGRLKVIDLAGKVLLDYPTTGSTSDVLDVSNLSPGIYHLEFQSVIGVQRVKFVKQ